MKKLLTILALLLTVCTMYIKAEVVYSGDAHNVANWQAKQLTVANYPKLAKASAGDVIAVSVSAVEDGARICLQKTDYKSFSQSYDEYDCTTGTYYFVLNSTDAAEVATNGLNVSGQNYSFNKVELLYKKTLWTGTVNGVNSWTQTETLDKSIFSGLSEGSLLGFVVSAINEGGYHTAVLRYNYVSNILDLSFSATGTKVKKLTSTDIEQLQDNNVTNLVACYLDISELCAYVENKYSLSLTHENGSIAVEEVNGETYTATTNTYFLPRTVLRLTATPTNTDSHEFDQWTSPASFTSGTATDATVTVTMNEDISATATFKKKAFTITAAVADGQSELGTAVVTTAANSGEKYEYGTEVTVTATPTGSNTFKEWTVGGTQVSTEAEYSFTVTEDRALVASFNEAPSPTYEGTELTPDDGSSVPTTFDGSWSSLIQFGPTKFSAAKTGDILIIYLSEIGEGPAIMLQEYYGTYHSLQGSSLSISDNKAQYVLDASAAAFLKDNGMCIKGANLTVDKVTLKDGGGSASVPELNVSGFYDIVYAVESEVQKRGKRNYLGSSSTTAASENQELLVTFAEGASDAKVIVSYVDGTADAEATLESEATTVSVPLTSGKAIKKVEIRSTADDGTIKFTLSSIAIQDIASVTQYILTVTQPENETGTIQIGETNAVTTAYDENTELTLSAVPISNYQFTNWTSTTDGVLTDANRSVSPLSVTMNKNIDISAVFSVVNAKILDWKHEYTSNSDYDISSATVGDKVRITFSKTSEEGGDMYLKVSAKSDTWAYDPTFHDGTITETTYDIDVTSTNQANITARGLYLQGSNITITNIEVISAKTTQALKNATQKMVNETVGTKVLIANTAFANVSAGDIITVNMSEVATSGAFIVLKENSGTSLFGSNYSSALTSGQTSFTHTLSADDITLLTGDNKALCITGEGFTCGNITITSAGSITADAAHTTMYVLSVTQPAAGGTIQIGGTDAVAQKAYDNGSQVTLTAVRNGGYALSKWTKDGADAGSENTLSVTFDGADVAVTATFVEDGSDPNVIWEGNEAISWNEVAIAAGKFSQISTDAGNRSLQAGDKLVFGIEYTGGEYPQMVLRNSSSADMAGSSTTSLSEGMTQVTYFINSQMLAELSSGLKISGTGFNLKSVKLEAGDGGDYSKSVWIGNTVLPSDWSGYQQIAASCFTSAEANQILRIKVKDLKTSPTISLCQNINGWPALYDGSTGVALSGGYFQTPITSDMLSKLQANGLIIAGCSFTITSVDILNAGDIKPLTLAVDVENNWIFSSAPTITIKVTNPYNVAMTANAELQVTTDKLDAYTTLTQSVSVDANGSKNIALTFPSTPPAGFYKATALVNGDLARSFYFGVNPTQIVSAPDKQNDFDSYWAAAKQQLDAVVASDEPVLTEVTEKSTSNRKVYLVEFKSIPDGTSGDPVTIRGYYCEPTDGEKHPVLMHYQGYDSFTYGPGGTAPEVYCPSGDDNPDYAEFVLSTRGQVLNNREPYVSNGGNPYGQDGWFKANFGNKDSYYYRGAYMDVVRAIEFMASRSTSDMDNLFAEGQSQGGAFTYAAAALSGRTFKAIAPAITFMGDFPDYFDLASWPGNEAKEKQAELGWTDTQLYNFLSYFDTKNLATKVSCPVITSIGVQDNICPPHTNIAPYNNVTTTSDKKQIVYNAELQHATNSDWNTTYMAFFENYKTALPDNRTEKTINETSTTISADPDQGLTISKVKFTNASSGDIIKVYVSNVASGATITMKEAGGDWSQLTSGSVSGDNYSYKLSAADVAKVKANGLHIMGNGFTSTKVTLKTEGEIPSDEEDPQPSQTGVNISLDDLNEGWSSSYNATTKTITTEGEWAARGWYIGDNRYNSKGSVTVKFEAVNFGVTLKMEYTNTGGESKSVSAGAAAGETGVELDIPADIKTMDKVYITYQPIGTLKLTEATVNDKVVDNRTERTLVEKSQAISDGDIAINRGLFSNAVAGDEIRIYADGLSESSKLALEPGDYSGAFDGANWTGFTESPFKLKLTATLIATIKEKGLLIRGESFTFKKAVLYTEKELGSEISDEEKKGDEEKDDEEKIIDKKTGEADLTVLSAQDDTKTTLTENEDGSITMTTTEPYCAAQIWFNDPEPVAGNVLKVELAESKVNVTITVQYTDGTQSQMSANTSGVATARAATRGDSDPGTTIEVPLETGKEVQNIEVKNNVAGTITIKKMQMTTINIFTNGVANLSMLKPQSNATYDTSTHTLATTKGWTGATISPVGGENVSGKELLIEFADASKVKVAVKYRTDVEGPSTIMEKAAKAVRLALDNTKNIQEISIQPTEASIVTFKKIAVNSEESDDGTLKPGKTITLWENAAGETLSWNEVAKQDASVGEMLQEYDELLITISGVTEGCDWPKVFIRDASSEQAGNEVLLNDVGSFPYTVRIVLTGEMAQQLQKGFSICGDGVTVTKLQVYRPEAPKTGDIHLADLNYGYNSSYDKGTHTITTTARWAARGWEIGDKRYNDKNLITVKFEPVDFPVTLKMEYTTGLQTAQATSVGVPAGRTELLLEIPSGISKLNRVYIIYENPGSIKLTEASVTYQDKLKLSTAIEAFEAEGVIRDGRYDTDGWYNLRGMRIAEPKTSGIYIHGGKKVVIY